MAQSFDSLFWSSHAAFHPKLQDGNFSKTALDDHFEWLLLGTQKFKPCNESSRKQIMEKLKLEVKGKSFVYDAKLRPLALRAAKLLDLDEVQVMLLLKRWLKDSEPELKLEDLPENDPAAMSELMLQVLRYYNSERLLLLKCIQVVMLKAGEADEAGSALADLLSRLVQSNIEEQLHARLRENLEGGAAAITRRLKAGDAAAAGAAGGAAAAGGAVVATPAPAGGTAASLSWLSAVNGEMRSQLVSERLELLNCLLLLYEVCGVACKPERAQALARLLLDRVFASFGAAGGGAGAAATAAADAPTALSQQLAALLLMSCLDLPGHVRLTAAAAAPPPGGAADAALPLGGKTMDVHNQISQYAASPATALLLLTWAGCLRLLDVSGGGHMIRDLDGATRELDARVGAVGGLAAAVGALAALCGGAVGALLLVYRGVAAKALCVLCTAFDLGVDNVDPAMYEAVTALIKLCMEGDARACASLWDESLPTTAPLRSLLAAAARLFPAVPHHLLQLLRLTAASPDTARAAYAFLQRGVSLVVLHAASEPAIRHLGGGEVELAAQLPWNLAPSVPGLALPQGCVGTLCPLPAVLSELRGRYMLVSWECDVSGGGGNSRGQILLLGRASHCVASLEHALLHSLPLERSDPTLLRDLSDTLSLLAALCALEPALVADLMVQSVPFGSGTTRTWLDVVAGVLALGPQLAAAASPPPLQLLADAAELLGAVSELSPGKVLALLPQLPLLASPGGDLLAGLPPRGFVAAPLPVAALFVLYELLPNHHQWRYASAKERWALTRGSLRVLRLALTAGAFVSDPDISVLAAPPPPKAAALTLPARGGGGPTLLLTYPGGGGGSAAAAAAAGGEEEAGASLTPDEIMAAAGPRLHVSVLSAALLKLLLLHGGVLLARTLPPPADVLERLRADDPSRPELPLLEQCAGEMVQLIPPLLAAAGVHPQEQPFEEFMFAGQEPTPAAHVASYIAYHEADRDVTPAERQISYLALRALLSIAASVARPVSRSLPGVTLALAVPGGSPAEACLRALLRGDAAAAHPAHHALSAQLAADAVGCHAELLDALLFPSELEEEQRRQRSSGGGAGAGAAPPLALPAPEGAAAGGGGAGGGGGQAVGARRGPRARQALDGLYATLQQAARLKREQPQVLASSLRVVAAMWRQPAAAHRAVSVLRAAPALWSSLEACLEPTEEVGPAAAAGGAGGASGAGGAPSPGSPQAHHQTQQQQQQQQQLAASEARAHRALCEAFALQILTAEAFARARFPAAASAAAAAAAAATDGTEAQALLDKLARGGLLLRLLRGAAAAAAAAAAEPPAGAAAAAAAAAAVEARSVGTLQAAAAALYMEMGAGVVSELWGTAGEPDGVSVGPAVREELSAVRSLVAQGGASLADIQAAHDDLLVGAGALQHSAAAATHGSPPVGVAHSPSLDDSAMLQLPPTHPLAQLLQRQCLGAALVSRCHVATTDLAQLPCGPAPPGLGPDHLLSRPRLLALLGPAAEQLHSADLLLGALAEVNMTSSLGEALQAQLQAACALISVLAQDGRLLPPHTTTAAAAAAAALFDPPPAAADGPSTSTAPPAGGAAAGGAAGGLLTSVQSACWSAVSGLLAWCDSPDSRAAMQPDWGMRRLHAHHVAAALAASRLLLSVLESARQALTAPPPPAAAAAAPAAATPARSPGLGGVFGTPIALTPVATAPRAGRQGGGGAAAAAAAAAAAGGAAADPAYLPFVVALARQLAAWSRKVAAAGLPQCPPAAAAQITDGLAGSLLLALQPLQPEAAVAVAAEQQQWADRQQLAASLLSMIPQLCDLAASGTLSTSLAAQLLLETTRHLAPSDWLPLLLNNLDLGQHILAAASRAAALAAAAAASGGATAAAGGALRGADAAAAAGDLGILALALAVAQVPDGARALYDRGVADQLVAAGRHLLSGSGGRLAAFSVIAVTGTGPYRPGVDGTYASTSGRGAAAVARGGGPHADTCGAYLPSAPAAAEAGEGEVWSPVHRQWCTLLQFSAALLRTLGQHVSMEREALDLMLAVEPRLMLAVLPPGGDLLQPLTLAGLVELEAALFLMGEMTAYLGGWHMVLPASLINFRTAVSTLLTWLAQPTLAKSFAVDCRPRTPREAALAATPAPGIPAADGWFRACTHGAAAAASGGAAAKLAAAASLAAAGGGGGIGSPIAGAIPSVGSLSRGISEATPPYTPLPGGGPAAASPSRAASGLGAALGTPGGAATPGGGGAAIGGGGGGGGGGVCSEYSAQMAEKLYTCAQHALLFLVASSPQLSPGEAASLGPAWPRPRDLSALLDQCMCASEALALATDTPPGAAGLARRARLMRLMGRVGQLCGNFLSVLAAGGAAGGAGAREQLAREWLASLELGSGSGSGGLGGVAGFGMGVGPQAVPAN
ncbi:hypothetical protein PLESTB_000216500 [Pleodorina starrii]|uniref:Uncharacterized protein n=1 Tax=Pleodorina starrii TaxID=330485 RepID=A0A9W6BC47_9CHLO|nr:hypothetical protein PLESTB_000216500 [Pleodorina starrii]